MKYFFHQVQFRNTIFLIFQDMFYSEIGHFIAQRKSLGVAQYITDAMPVNSEASENK